MSGPDAHHFQIAYRTGQIYTKTDLDFEVREEYTVVVKATDAQDRSATTTVNITVENVDEEGTVRFSSRLLGGVVKVRV